MQAALKDLPAPWRAVTQAAIRTLRTYAALSDNDRARSRLRFEEKLRSGYKPSCAQDAAVFDILMWLFLYSD